MAEAESSPSVEADGSRIGLLAADFREEVRHGPVRPEDACRRLDAGFLAVPEIVAVKLGREAGKDALPVDGRGCGAVAPRHGEHALVTKAREVWHLVPRDPPRTEAIDADHHHARGGGGAEYSPRPLRGHPPHRGGQMGGKPFRATSLGLPEAYAAKARALEMAMNSEKRTGFMKDKS